MSNLVPDLPPERGMIAWMARNTVAANLLFLLVILGGVHGLLNVKKEIFPTFPADTLTITVPYPGSSPEEVEDGVIIKIEEAIQDIEGIKEIRSTASEGRGVVTVEVEAGLDVTNVLNKVKVRVDGIASFPTQTETPIIDEVARRVRVLDLSIHGALDEHELKHLADDVRNDLLALPQITQITVEGVRDYEIAIEVSDIALQEYQLSFDEVVQAIRNQSKDIPGGKLRTDARTITLRSLSQARTQSEYEHLVLLTGKDGTQVTVGDVAKVRDTFSETPLLNRLNGQPAATLQVNRVGRQSALEISDAVKAYAIQKQARLPQGVHLEVWSDRTNTLKGRIKLLLTNAVQGMILVIITLALFLNLSLAFWVAAGLPFSFLGALMLMSNSNLDYSINVISLFGFILVLGILVDDAIVTAESVYDKLEEENKGIESVIRGVKRVSVATIFGVLTTIIAFAPMLFLTEGMAQMFSVVGAVVIMCLTFSIIESKLILPAHLSHLKVNQPTRFRILKPVEWLQNKVSGYMNSFIHNGYKPFLDFTLKNRYSALAVFLVILMTAYALLPSGVLRFVFFPRIPSDFINVQMQMPQGTSHQITQRYALQIEEAALKLNEDYKKQYQLDVDLIAQLETQVNGDTQASIKAELIPSTERTITSVEIAQRWRDTLGDMPGVRSLRIDASAGRSSPPIDIELRGGDLDTLRLAADEVKQALRGFDGVYDIRDTFDGGGSEVNITLTAEGQSLGLGHAELARQIRQAFFGAEIQRIQRGRHEVRIYTRLPLAERNSLQALRDLWIRLPNGDNVPFSVVGQIHEQTGVSVINRKNRMRVVEVLADLDKTKVEPNRVTSVLQNETLKDIHQKYPSVSFYFGGEAEEQAASTKTLGISGVIMLMLIYAALAIPLRSYLKPLAIMSVLPFGVVGAFLGHILLGTDLNILSIVGIIALMGILVNDSLVLVDYMNQAKARGHKWRDAIQEAGVKRFRAVFLTSITTFFGLLPIQMESSIQAQFLKPMAISVSFGVLFATVMTLLLVPVLLLIADDIKLFFSKNKA